MDRLLALGKEVSALPDPGMTSSELLLASLLPSAMAIMTMAKNNKGSIRGFMMPQLGMMMEVQMRSS